MAPNVEKLSTCLSCGQAAQRSRQFINMTEGCTLPSAFEVRRQPHAHAPSSPHPCRSLTQAIRQAGRRTQRTCMQRDTQAANQPTCAPLQRSAPDPASAMHRHEASGCCFSRSPRRHPAAVRCLGEPNASPTVGPLRVQRARRNSLGPLPQRSRPNAAGAGKGGRPTGREGRLAKRPAPLSNLLDAKTLP